MPQLPLSYDSPLEAVFLRILAWEIYVAKKKPKVGQIAIGEVQTARKEIGLPPYKISVTGRNGGPHAFFKKLRSHNPPIFSAKQVSPHPMQQQWRDEWRLLYLPPHDLVRRLSHKPVVIEVGVTLTPGATHQEFLVTLRDPSLPPLHVFVGSTLPPKNTFSGHRGLYFLRFADYLYLGQTDEFDVRLFQHNSKANKQANSLLWWVFVSPEQSFQAFTLDALAAAESLLISFWNETTCVRNRNRGRDQRPAFGYLQQGILLVEAASAILLWLIREKKDLIFPSWDIPFKEADYTDWPDCYMQPPE